jgi:predicted transcriptional regulator
MTFGPYLKRCRIDASLTQKELARRCALGDACSIRLEDQETDPRTRDVCSALAPALGIDEMEIWKFTLM